MTITVKLHGHGARVTDSESATLMASADLPGGTAREVQSALERVGTKVIARAAAVTGEQIEITDWKGTAQAQHERVLELERVIREYVGEVENGEKFGALVESVPGLESDDGQYGGRA